jgi:LPS export ABC transporter permease LptG/LPS export ABC transporter permease LptF
MLRTIDRYVIREILPPFLLSLLIFTFILEIPPVMQQLEKLVAKGVSWQTAGMIMLTLIPQGLGLTIPMAFLCGLLIGLGRLSADREAVALLACGVSPYRLLRPVGALALVCTAATTYVMIEAIPNANQTFREITFEIVSKRAENEVRPRVFYEDFPGWVLYARDEPPTGGGWKDVLVADTRQKGVTEVFLASRGRLIVDREKRTVELALEDGTRYASRKPGETEIENFSQTISVLDPQSVFGRPELPRGLTEKTIAELRKDAEAKRRAGLSDHNEVMWAQQKFSIPVACLVFGVIGLALGLTVARDGKLAGFVLGILVIFAYYVVMYLSESMTKGAWLPAIFARWVPNIVLGIGGILALVWRSRWAERRLPITLPIGIPRLPARWHRASAAAPSSSAQPRGRRVVVVVRFPRLRMPTPGLLDRYISRIYIRMVGLSFLALLGLVYISTFIDRSDKLFKGQASTGMLASLLVYFTPQFVYYVIPIAALLSVLVTFGILSRTSELTVMKACGVSLYRLALPVVMISLVWSAVLFALEQEILGRANRRAAALDDRIRGREPRIFNPVNRRWVTGRDGSIYHYGYYDQRQKALTALSIYRVDPAAWRLASQTYANRAAFGTAWIADTGWTQTLSSRPPVWRPFKNETLSVEPPDYFESESTEVELMTVPQLRRLVEELSSSGFNYIPPAVELQKKLAFPFVTFVMTLLAVPFGVTTGRRGTLYGIGLGIVIALSYWVVSSVFVAVGKAGLLSPELAGWTPNIIVVACALYLMLTTKT